MKGFYIDSATQMALLALFDHERLLASKRIQVGPLAKENIFAIFITPATIRL